jgi:hypothetical protein
MGGNDAGKASPPVTLRLLLDPVAPSSARLGTNTFYNGGGHRDPEAPCRRLLLCPHHVPHHVPDHGPKVAMPAVGHPLLLTVDFFKKIIIFFLMICFIVKEK